MKYYSLVHLKNYRFVPGAITLILLFLTFTHAMSEQKPGQLVVFNTLDSGQFTSNDATLSLIENEAIRGIAVKSRDGNQASLVIKPLKCTPWDLTDVYTLKASVTNLASHSTQIAMYVGLDPDPLMRWYCSDYVDLKPGETKTITVQLTWLPWVHRPPFQYTGMRGTPGCEKTPREAIQQISFSVRYPESQNYYSVNRIFSEGTTEFRDTSGFFPFVNEFGQYAHDYWIGKIETKKALADVVESEIKQLSLANVNPEIDKYGGWLKGPRFTATGSFYPVKHEGKWWLVDPDGFLFWSAGVNCVSSQSVFTVITGRESYFSKLPKKSATSAPFFDERFDRTKPDAKMLLFNHFEHNLYLALGNDYLPKFRELTHNRFKNWGLNTIGFVSDQVLAAQHKTPYVGAVWIRNTRKIEGSSGYQGKFHDVFDADFEKNVRTSVEAQKFGANDPWCIGYFVDNEMSWGGAGSLSLATLSSPADQPAKRAFIADLRKKYATIAKLNLAWHSGYSSWDDMLKATQVPNETYARDDLNRFYDQICRKYFQTVHDELKRVAPNQNYLGCRLAWAQNDITLRAAAEYCDIISFNKYEFSVQDVTLPEGVDKPVIIGEFHFGSTDRGFFHPGVKQSENQTERGQMYQKYIQSALRNKLIVGAHWFQYIDEPITGRADGENYNVGLVDVCNVPYPELLNKVKATCNNKYTYRSTNN